MGMTLSRANDDLLSQASVTIASGTPLTGYDIENINDRNWALPVMVSETELIVEIEFLAPTSIDWVILGNSDVDIVAKWQGNSVPASWTTPPLDLSFAIPSVNARGIYSSPHLNTSAQTAYQYYRLKITGNTLPVILGELGVVATRYEFSNGFKFDETELTDIGNTSVKRTGHGVKHAYERHSGMEGIIGTIICTTAEMEQLRECLNTARFQARPFWILPNNDYTDAWFVTYISDSFSKRPLGSGLWSVNFGVEQQSRGLSWIDPDE